MSVEFEEEYEMSDKPENVYGLLDGIFTKLTTSLDVLYNVECTLVQRPDPSNPVCPDYMNIALAATATCFAVKYLLGQCMDTLASVDYDEDMIYDAEAKLTVSLDMLHNVEHKLVQRPDPRNPVCPNYMNVALAATATCLALRYLLEECMGSLSIAEQVEEDRKLEEDKENESNSI